MTNPLISIILPTYNSEKTIIHCLESIARQSFRNFEIVIMDGLSTDNTIGIIKSYGASLNINLVSEKDNGIYDAMNKGLQIAKGAWIYFLGSDDTLFDKEVLLNIASEIAEYTDIIYGDSVWLPENVREEGEWKYSRLLKKSINHQRIFYRKNLFLKHGDFDLCYKIAADHALNIRFFCEPSVTKKYINLPVAYYNSRGFSANKLDEQFWSDWKKLLLKNFKPYLSQKEIYQSIGWYCWHNIHLKKYTKAARIFSSVFFHTYSVSFLIHTLSQAKTAIRNSFAT